MHIKITKGLDIPIKGKPEGQPKPLVLSGTASIAQPSLISLDLKHFEDVKFKILVKPDDQVKIGQPLAEDKSSPGRMFCSPAAGTIKEVRRGLRRSLLDIVINVASQEEYYPFQKVDVEHASKEQILELLKTGGIFSRIRSRPFNFLADPAKPPRNIFVKAIESAPFTPSAEMQVAGFEKEFQAGLSALSKLTSGKVHLVYRSGTPSPAFLNAKDVEKHTAEGPHPIGNSSVHIQFIDPIKSVDDNVWVLNAHTVISIGYLLMHGKCYTRRIISIAGPGILPDKIGFFETREGVNIQTLLSGRVAGDAALRYISGDLLTGYQVEQTDFLGFDDFQFCAVPESEERQFLHFFRLGFDRYSFSKTYASGHLNNKNRVYDFSTSLHGEHRAFVDSTLYDKVMPLPISTMLLVKAVMAEDFDLAEQLGLLSVDSEDFALPTFVCPSKMEMISIMKTGLKRYAADVLT